MSKEVNENKQEITTEIIADYLLNFFGMYSHWRESNGLNGSLENVHEILTSMTDKYGRICRQVKHKERNDPKDNWPTGMGEDLMGFLAYTHLLLNYYDEDIDIEDIRQGLINELNASIEQHG